MSFQPYDRNPSGIVFFGTAASDKLYESVSTFTYDTSNNALKIANGGYIGSQSDFDAISIASNGNVTLSQSLSIAGNLTVNGTTTTVNSTTVTVEDPIIFLGSGAPTTDDNLDRGIAFNWHTGSVARSGFFGFDDSIQGFTFIPIATGLGGNVVTGGGAGWAVFAGVSGALAGNATTATTLETARNFSVTGNMTAQAVSFNGSAPVVLTGVMHPTAISDRTEITSVEGTLDYLLIWDATDSGLKRINRTNFITGLGSMSSFTISDGSNTQTISDSETLFFRSGPAISFTVSATDQVSGTLNAAVAGNGLNMTSQVLAVGAGSGITVGADQISVTAGSGITVDANGVHVTAGTGLANTAGGLQIDLSEFAAVTVASGDSFATLDSDNATEQRTTISDLGSYFASHPQGGIGVLGDGKLTIDLSEFPSISVASGDSFATLDSNGSTEQLTTISDLGIYFASQANGGIGVLGDGKLTIDLSEYITPVAVASGDSFLMLDSDGSTEQRSTVSQLGAYLAGTNVTAGGDGKLSVTAADIETAVFTSANFVDSARIDFTVTAGQSVTADILGASITETYLSTSVAGNGLTGGSGTALAVGAGDGITVGANDVAVTDGSGILVNANGVHANLVDYTIQSVAANARTTTASRTYAVQVNGSDQLVVNVPWTDADTTYSAGSGLTLVGTTFHIASTTAGSGLAFDANGLHLDLNEYSSISIASGDRLLTLDSNNATEQLTTIVDLGQFMAGNGLVDNGAGALAVNTDNSTVEISSDILRIKDSGVTEVKRSRTTAAVSTSVTLSNDINLCTAGAGGITVTLPAVITGKVVRVKKVDSAAGTVTVQRGGSSTIDGATTVVLYHQWESLTVASDGTNWYIV